MGVEFFPSANAKVEPFRCVGGGGCPGPHATVGDGGPVLHRTGSGGDVPDAGLACGGSNDDDEYASSSENDGKEIFESRRSGGGSGGEPPPKSGPGGCGSGEDDSVLRMLRT